MEKRQVGVILGCIAFLCAAFWFLNFRVAASSTNAERTIIKTGMGIEDELPKAMQRREKISIALVGEGALLVELKKALVSEMNYAGIGNTVLVQGLQPRYQNPALVIQVGKSSLFWTPCFASSQFTIWAGYSSIGDTTFIGENPVTIDNQDGPILNLYGEYKVRDRSWGLISRVGYRQFLADYVARQIVATLKQLYGVTP